MIDYDVINYRRAAAEGWTNIIRVPGSKGTLLGAPPDGGANSRGQAMVPDYCGDWRHAGRALSTYAVASVMNSDVSAFAVLGEDTATFAVEEFVLAHGDLDTAIRAAIIKAETSLLDARVRRILATIPTASAVPQATGP